MDTDKSKHWSSFWRQGHITTFGEAQRDNYQGPIKAFWLDQYTLMPLEASVLDVATGNGALAQLAAEFGSHYEKRWTIHGSDLAQIQDTPKLLPDPKSRIARTAINFHSGVACEALPFDDCSFDLVTSQFGFEYSDLERSIPEIFRVTKTDGRFCAIFHHEDSVTLAGTKKEIAVYKAALDKHRIFTKATHYLQARASSATDLNTAKNALNQSVNALLQRFPNNPCCKQLIGALTGTMKMVATDSIKKVVAKLGVLEEDFSSAHRRLQDLVAASCTEEQIPDLIERFRHCGFTDIITGKVEFSEHEILGHSLIARK